MAFYLNNISCIDPKFLRDQQLEAGLPVLEWWGLANRYTNVLGFQGGGGHLLLTETQLEGLDWTARHKLKIEWEGKGFTIEIRLTGFPKRLVPGAGVSPYLVSFCDMRGVGLGHNTQSINQREQPYFELDSVKTVEQALTTLWNQSGAGFDCPALDAAVSGLEAMPIPVGGSCADAIDYLLASVGRAIYYNVWENRLQIIDTNVSPTDFNTDVALLRNRLLFDGSKYSQAEIQHAKHVRVLFPVWKPVQAVGRISDNAVYCVDVLDQVRSGNDASVVIVDSLPCPVDQSGKVSTTASASLLARAQRVAAMYADAATNPFACNLIYSGIVEVSDRGCLDAISYECAGNGVRTHFFRKPYLNQYASYHIENTYDTGSLVNGAFPDVNFVRGKANLPANWRAANARSIFSELMQRPLEERLSFLPVTEPTRSVVVNRTSAGTTTVSGLTLEPCKEALWDNTNTRFVEGRDCYILDVSGVTAAPTGVTLLYGDLDGTSPPQKRGAILGDVRE
jgi:hypothetical protein